jgi:hypothetical protein
MSAVIATFSSAGASLLMGMIAPLTWAAAAVASSLLAWEEGR